MKDLFRLDGSVIIITGGTGGIGSKTILALAEYGADVIVVDIIPEEEVAELLLSVKSHGKRAFYFKCDVSDTVSIRKMVGEVMKEFGKIDTLFNNAASAKLSMAMDMVDEDWDNTVRVSLKGSFICSREVGKIMMKQGHGSIINMASIAGLVGLPRGTAHHSAAKAGVMGLTRALAVEWAKYGIRVNALVPGQIMTPPLQKIMENPENTRNILSNIPLGRVGSTEEIAAAVIFLASKASSFMTGHALVVDGGATIM